MSNAIETSTVGDWIVAAFVIGAFLLLARLFVFRSLDDTDTKLPHEQRARSQIPDAD